MVLKLTYAEDNFHPEHLTQPFELEHVTQSLEEWVSDKILFSLRLDLKTYFEPSWASLLLPTQLINDRTDLTRLVQGEVAQLIEISACDRDFHEISLKGTWIAVDAEDKSGIFVASIPQQIELLLLQLWQEAQEVLSVISYQ